MRLDQEIVKRGLCASRKEAQEIIEQGGVFLNGIVCLKQTMQVKDEDEIIVTSRRKYVSRGGEKLEGVLFDLFVDEDKIRRFCLDKTALDIGSSTGGFTDCLLSYGVASVDAIDVGSSQLHKKIREDNRVNVFENTDIRYFDNNDKKYDIVVADLSFISLENILDNIITFGKSGTNYFLLLKPQFEVGRGNTKKGIVKDTELVDSILKKYSTILKEKGLKEIKIFPSHIKGGEGNQEYFIHALR